MEPQAKPDLAVARKTLPAPLFKALSFLMNMKLTDCALVGGTALSGFYTGHRRSDDIDLFAKNETAFKEALMAVKSLKKIGVEFHSEKTTPFYYRANCSLENHSFTVDAVLDENLFKVGHFHTANGLPLADLPTLLKMKLAALVSRTGEKDLSDLIRLFEIFHDLSVERMVELGQEIDGGVNAETMLASVGGTTLREEACDFALDDKLKQEHVFKEIKDFQKKLIRMLIHHLQEMKAPEISQLVKSARKVLR